MYSQTQQEQIPATVRYAGVGVRFLALLIDVLIVDAVCGIIIGAAAITHSSLIIGIAVIICVIFALLYGIGMEATQGAALGKKALGLQVVKVDGSSPIGWSASVLRNLLRIVDGLFGYLVGALIIWQSPLKQRLGDKVAHTTVIRTK
jgi:uncharacterized RDD family membrane protein YckC